MNMELTLRRIAKRDTYTIGKLYINGVYFCDTIEDKDRGLTQSTSLDEIKKKKVYSKTAIPTGTYEVTMGVYSNTFGKKAFYKQLCKGYVPRLKNVPGFEGILIHVGNTADDSAGCILVGKNTVVGKVLDSKNTFTKLYAKLKEVSNKGEQIKITIK